MTISIPNDLRESLSRHGQEHVLSVWDQLRDPSARQALLAQLESLDLDQLSGFFALRDKAQNVPSPDHIHPATVIAHDAPDNAQRRQQGEAALLQGEIAALLVAGGQGSRLGFDQPKGMYPVGPVSGKTLFQIHAEKVLALSRRYGRAIPFLIMTSPATHAETVDYFGQNRDFGLVRGQVQYFTQATMPALDLATGRLLFEAPGKLFLSPDGHGGTLTALARSGLLAQIQGQGIRHVFYFQVDNPLVKIADPVFLGHHLSAGAEVSSKVIAKTGPREKMGVLATVGGRCTIVEYSDLPDELAHATDERGRLRLWAGSPAIHFFDVGFLDRMTRDPEALPFHIARKKVPYLDLATGEQVDPQEENALKFERFIFDVLPRADHWTVVEARREEEFAPLKNAKGDDSPETVDRALCELARAWVTRAGGEVAPGVKVEISPLLALDADELAGKLPPGLRITEAKYLS